MAKEATTQVVSKESQLAERNEKRQKMVDLLTAKIEEKNKALESKKYIIEGGAKTADAIIDFLTNDAQWKFSEALGVIEAVKQIEEGKKGIAKSKELYVSSLALEAVYYFLTKVEAKGLSAAKEYVEVLKPISDALSRSKQDRQDIDQMVRDRGTLESAIDNMVDIENEDDILKEIQAELEIEL